MPKPNQPASPDLPFYTIKQVAERLQLSDKSIRRMIKAGDLIAHIIGNQYRVSKADLDVFLRLRRGLIGED